MDVVVTGDLNVDLVLAGVPMLPSYREIRLAGDMRLALGGSAAIAACNMARLGLKVGFVGKIGADELGDFLVGRLEQSGVDTSRVVRSTAGATGICVVISCPAEYAMVSYPGIRETFTLDDVDIEYVRKARHLHMVVRVV